MFVIFSVSIKWSDYKLFHDQTNLSLMNHIKIWIRKTTKPWVKQTFPSCPLFIFFVRALDDNLWKFETWKFELLLKLVRYHNCLFHNRKLRIWSNSLKKSLMENFIFCALFHLIFSGQCSISIPPENVRKPEVLITFDNGPCKN